MLFSLITSTMIAFDIIAVKNSELHTAFELEYKTLKYDPIDFSVTFLTFAEIYFDRDVTSGYPMLAALAVLLGKMGATKSSVKIML